MYFRQSLLMIFLLGTWVVAPIALMVLFKKRSFRLVFYFTLAIILGPVLFRLIMSIEDQHLRIWVVMPISLFLPTYLMLGFWICVKAYDTLNEQNPRSQKMPLAVSVERKPFRMTARRYVGVLLFAIGIAAWSFGATHPQLGNGQQTLVAGVALYSLLIGGVWAATGKKLW
jgi:Ca2+/Na+ antiporter